MKTGTWIATCVALVVIVGAAAGYGGYSYGIKTGQAQAQNLRATFQASRGTGANGPTAGGGAGMPGQGVPGQIGGANSANFANGQIKQVDGQTIQLSTATEVLTIKIVDQTQIQKTGQGSLSDLKTGERITVQGSRASDGTFTAEMVQIGGRMGGNPPQPAGAAAAGN